LYLKKFERAFVHLWVLTAFASSEALVFVSIDYLAKESFFGIIPARFSIADKRQVDFLMDHLTSNALHNRTAGIL
jgi:hypothetical protein